MKAKNRIPRDSLSETVGLEDLANEIAKKIVDAFRNKKCWYASAGGSTSPTFALAFGRKVRRQAPLENEAHPRDYRQYEGEVNLYVEKACRPWLLAISGTFARTWTTGEKRTRSSTRWYREGCAGSSPTKHSASGWSWNFRTKHIRARNALSVAGDISRQAGVMYVPVASGITGMASAGSTSAKSIWAQAQ